MTYNIHPILVHFPIALLFLYSFVKILPFKRWFPRVAWKDIERALLLVGVLGAFAALATGETAEHLVRPSRELVNMHSTFATLATWLYGALLVGEILSVINPIFLPKISSQPVTKFARALEKLLCNNGFSKFLAFCALIAILVTGLLGGVMVFGTTTDPLAPMVLNILGITP